MGILEDFQLKEKLYTATEMLPSPKSDFCRPQFPAYSVDCLAVGYDRTKLIT